MHTDVDKQADEMHQAATRQAVAQIAQAAETWPVKRAWLPLSTRITSSTSAPASGRSTPALTLVSYNLLAQCLIRRKMFSYCSKQSLRLHHRRGQLTAELLSYKADILALQEVDADHFEQHYKAVFDSYGYSGRFGAGRGQGSRLRAVFQTSALRRGRLPAAAVRGHGQRVRRRENAARDEQANVAQILTLTHRTVPSCGVIISNTHCFWEPTHRFLKLRQCERLLQRVHDTALQHKLPALLAGDYNLTPATHIYSWLVTRQLERQFFYKYISPPERDTQDNGEATVGSKPEDEQWDEADEKSVAEQRQHDARYRDIEQLLERSASLPRLTSVYSSYSSLVPPIAPQPYCNWQGEPAYTNYTGGWKGTLDYVFVMSTDTAQQQQSGGTAGVEVEVESVLELPGLDVVTSATALPNETLGSDHLAIGCQFRLASR